MARPFKNTVRGYTAYLENAERRILRTLFSDVLQLLGGAVPGQDAPEAGKTAEDSVLIDPEFESGRCSTSGDDAGDDATQTDHNSTDPIDEAFWDLVSQEPGLDPIPNAADPAIQALLPPGRSGEGAEEGSAEFYDLAQDTIRAAKIADLQQSIAALQGATVTLTSDQAIAFSRALNQVRLVLATRLNIETERDAQRVADVNDLAATGSVEDYMALLYNFVSWLLDTLMTALTHGEL